MEEIEKIISDMKKDVTFTANHLLHCTIIKEKYMLKLLKYLFEKIEIDGIGVKESFKDSMPSGAQEHILTMEELPLHSFRNLCPENKKHNTEYEDEKNGRN